MTSPSSDNACPICNSTSQKVLLRIHTTRNFSITECCGCALVYSVPRPTIGELEVFYSSGYFGGGSRSDAHSGFGYPGYRGAAEINARRMWPAFRKYQARYAPAFQPVPKRVLDVGCATGGFLAEAKKDGWDAVGVEMAAEAVQVARQAFALEVFTGDIFSPQLEARSFGLLTMWHVLGAPSVAT